MQQKKILKFCAWISILISFSVINSGSFSSASPTPEVYELVELGQYPTLFARDVQVKDKIAYLTDMGFDPQGDSGLLILNVSNPQNIQKLSNFYDDGLSHQILINENLAFIADNKGGLEVINISDSTNPVKISTIRGTFNDITIKENYLYATDWFDGLKVFNINSNGSLDKVGSYPSTKNLQPIDFIDDYLFISGGDSTFIFDATNISNIQCMGNLSYDMKCIKKHYNFGYMVTRDGKLLTLDISDLLNISVLNELQFNGRLIDIEFQDNIAFITNFDGGIFACDISDPLNPYEICRFNDGGRAMDMFVESNIIYVADAEDGMEILKFQNKESKNIPGYSNFFIISIMSLIIIKKIIKWFPLDCSTRYLEQ
ncbi:hypothetical protein NEF87_002249 [Candidatus Lokiarchaeum ossiferum]|uniref:LVIVD repeat protein n=1 Tax=Candidatus Lokiarchaeum ossiferum TaxID=2951803 RepID=A0ABY6HTU0_9ARCH|nr:hypothetical protein NEF87_002249 [Candidatus Lokiarchaeum sp. B-35]